MCLGKFLMTAALIHFSDIWSSTLPWRVYSSVILSTWLKRQSIPLWLTSAREYNSCINNWCHQKGTMGQYTRCKSVSNNGRTCHHPEIKYGSTIGGKPGGVWIGAYRRSTNDLTEWCKQIFPRFGDGFLMVGDGF